MSAGISRRRFDPVELAAISAFVALVSWYLARTIQPPAGYLQYATLAESARLMASYGPTHFSENQEEWIIRDYFKDRRNGTFVDVGASHYRKHSNTYFLEERLGWSGIAVDPQEAYGEDYRKHRPRTRFFPLFVSDVSGGTAALFTADGNPSVASGTRGFTQGFGGRVREAAVPTVTLTDLLTTARITRIDLLSIDVELSEPNVLAGFDAERFRPALVCIEAHPDVRQQILDYFANHRYVTVGAYLRVDVHNLYFKPLDGAPAR